MLSRRASGQRSRLWQNSKRCGVHDRPRRCTHRHNQAIRNRTQKQVARKQAASKHARKQQASTHTHTWSGRSSVCAQDFLSAKFLSVPVQLKICKICLPPAIGVSADRPMHFNSLLRRNCTVLYRRNVEAHGNDGCQGFACAFCAHSVRSIARRAGMPVFDCPNFACGDALLFVALRRTLCTKLSW